MVFLALSILVPLFLLSCKSQSAPGESRLSVTFRANPGEPVLRITVYYTETEQRDDLIKGIEFCDKTWFLAYNCRIEKESDLAGRQVATIYDSDVLPDSDKTFSFEDLNFDGYLDLKFLWNFGSGRKDYMCWLYVPGQRTFKFHEGLSELPTVKADPKNNLVLSWEKAGDTQYTSTHRWINGNLILVEEKEGPVEWVDVPE